MKALKTTAAAATAAALLAATPLAGAAGTSGSSAPTGGKIDVWISDVAETHSKITITGAVGDYGTMTQTNGAGKPTPNGNFQHATLKHGTMVIDGSGLNKAFAHFKPTINKANCSVSFNVTGQVKIVSGTGDYAGATGALTVHVTFAGIAPKTKAGTCNLADSAPTYGAFGVITGSGSVSFKQ